MHDVPFLCADLDPALNANIQWADLCLKWALLYSPQLALTDVQLIHNPYLRSLVLSPEFQHLVQSRDSRSRPHVFASVRNCDFEHVLASQLDLEHKGKRSIAEIGGLSEKKQAKFHELRRKGEASLAAVYDLAPDLRVAMPQLQRLFGDSGQYRLYKKGENKYAEHVLLVLDSITQSSKSKRVLGACEELRKLVLARGAEQLMRSELWIPLGSFDLTIEEREYIRHIALIIPWNRSAALTDEFDMFYSTGLKPAEVPVAIEDQPTSVGSWELDSSSFYDPKALKYVGSLNYKQIAAIREAPEFSQTVSGLEAAMRSEDRKAARDALHGHVRYLDSAISDNLSVKDAPSGRLIVEVFGRAAEALVKKKLHLPDGVLGPMLSFVSDKMMLLVRSDKRSVLQTIGETLIDSAAN